MDFSNLRKYFNNYVKEYLPYKNINEYRYLMDFLVEYYYRGIYSKIPTNLNKLYEKQEIPAEIYDNLLINIGIPKKLIDKLYFKDKLIILNSLYDFQKYKSSILFAKKVATSFNDNFNIYELFIYRESDGSWVFKPYIIYKNDRVADISTQFFTYSEIYDSVPTLLVPSDQLEALYTNGQLVVPFKSNILLLDYSYSSSESQIMYELIISVFLKEYYDLDIHLYFLDNSFTSKLSNVYYLWYYLVTRYHNVVWKKELSNKNALRFLYTQSIDYSIEDLDQLSLRYDAITSRQELDSFYNEVFLNNYNFKFRIEYDYSYSDMGTKYSSLDPDIYDYITSRIDSAQDQKVEIDLILDEIYDSFLLSVNSSTDVNYKKYSDYFLRYLPQISVIPEKTPSFIMLYNFKPFHTEILNMSSAELVVAGDKFNNILIDDLVTFRLQYENSDELGITEEYTVFEDQ